MLLINKYKYNNKKERAVIYKLKQSLSNNNEQKIMASIQLIIKKIININEYALLLSSHSFTMTYFSYLTIRFSN